MNLCRCHGEPMISNGSHLVCAVKRHESQVQAQRRYKNTEKGRATTRRYESTPVRKLGKSIHEFSRIRVR